MTNPVVWRGAMKSDKGGGKEYTVTLFTDGTGVCSCPDYVIRGINDPTRKPDDALRYRCKHILRAAKANAPSWLDGQVVVDVPKEAPGEAKRKRIKAAAEAPLPPPPPDPTDLGVNLGDLFDRLPRDS